MSVKSLEPQGAQGDARIGVEVTSPMPGGLTPRETLAQNVRRRFAQGFQVRPTEDQVLDLERIVRALLPKDPRVTQADVVRGAIDFFIDAWQREQQARDWKK